MQTILKKILIVFLAGTTLSLAGVIETKHNFTSAVYSPNAFFYGTKQVCVFCHTTHNASQTYGALWNHEVNDLQSYIPYSSPTLDMPQSSPRNGSLICLSCHDGTIAVNSLNNLPGPEGAGNYGTPAGPGLDGSGRLTSSSSSYVSTDLSDDHPVGLTYDTGFDNDFVPLTGNPNLYPDKLLYLGNYVECTSCHNPHDNTWGDFLVESNQNSDLCGRCHVK